MRILCHPGLGDHLIINGLVREYVKAGNAIELAVKVEYLESLGFLYRDLSAVTLTAIPRTADPYVFQETWGGAAADCLRLGRFDPSWHRLLETLVWDEVFYVQGNVPIAKRWESRSVVRDPQREQRVIDRLGYQYAGYQILHEDRARGFLADRSLLDPALPIVELDPVVTGPVTNNIFDFISLFAGARAIHCFSSSFYHLADHFVDAPQAKWIYHDYIRPTPVGKAGAPWVAIHRGKP